MSKRTERRVLSIFTAVALALSSSSYATTVHDVIAKDRELQIAERQAKIDAMNDKALNGRSRIPVMPMPPPPERPKDKEVQIEDVRLVAIYGMRDKLFADLLVNGAVVSLKRGQSIAGWKILEVAHERVVITRAGGNHRRELFLSPPTQEGTGLAGVQLPRFPGTPIPGLPQPTATSLIR